MPKSLKVRHHQTNSIIHGNEEELTIRLSCYHMRHVAASGHTGFGHSKLHWVITSIYQKNPKKKQKRGASSDVIKENTGIAEH